ncbi:MAG: AAA family ATPase [Melioribacteraceae bacterium]|nr:AAA family ATPase [Melioribacteraceae bacterium]
MQCDNNDIRPITLAGFTGQREVVDRVENAITAAIIKKDAFPHTIMSGPPGLGKTTLASIIANEMDVPLIKIMATAIKNPSDIESILAKISNSGYNTNGEIINRDLLIPSVIFIDEIHRLPSLITELLHTVLEDNLISLKKKNYESQSNEAQEYWVPRFTLVGATNYMGQLPKPFLDRFALHFNFEYYSLEDIVKVLYNSSKSLGYFINDEGILEIAKRSRGIPRIANRFLSLSNDYTIAKTKKLDTEINFEFVNGMFKKEGIDEIGLDKRDRKALYYLSTIPRPIGSKSLAQAIDEDEDTLENSIEPYLVKLGFMVRTPQGRYITEEGKEYLGIINRGRLLPKKQQGDVK